MARPKLALSRALQTKNWCDINIERRGHILQLEKNLRFAGMQQPSNVILVELRKLKAHEEVDFKHLKELKKEIFSDKILKFAVAVDKDTNIILDGHHRFNALKELGCKRIPAVFVDLNSPQLEVNCFRNDRKVGR